MRLPIVMLALASLFSGFAVVPQAAAKDKDTTGQTQTQTHKKKVKKSKKQKHHQEKP